MIKDNGKGHRPLGSFRPISYTEKLLELSWSGGTPTPTRNKNRAGIRLATPEAVV